MKVIVLDIPRPQCGVIMPDVKPGDIPSVTVQDAEKWQANVKGYGIHTNLSGNGNKPPK